MIGLPSLEIYNSFFNITEENNRFGLYTDNLDKFSSEELKDELEEILSLSVITSKHLNNEKIGPRFIQAYENLRSEKLSPDGYIIILMGYARSPFRDFGSYLRIVVGMDDHDIQLILKPCNSNFVTYEITPGIYSIEDVSEAVYTMGDHEGTFTN